MIVKSLLTEIQEYKIVRITSWIGLISAPFLFMLGAYIFSQYMTVFSLKEFILLFILSFVFYWIVSKAQLLRKYIVSLEPIILKEIDPWLSEMNISFSSLKKQKRHVMCVISIPMVAFSLIYFASFLYPIPFVRDALVLSIIFEVLLVGLFKLTQFKDYINELSSIYIAIVKSSGKDVKESQLMSINIKRIVLDSFILGVVFFLISNILLTNIKTLPLLLITLSFCVLFTLGKGLYDAYKGFYKSLSQIDELRSKIGILKLNKDKE